MNQIVFCQRIDVRMGFVKPQKKVEQIMQDQNGPGKKRDNQRAQGKSLNLCHRQKTPV